MCHVWESLMGGTFLTFSSECFLWRSVSHMVSRALKIIKWSLGLWWRGCEAGTGTSLSPANNYKAGQRGGNATAAWHRPSDAVALANSGATSSTPVLRAGAWARGTFGVHTSTINTFFLHFVSKRVSIGLSAITALKKIYCRPQCYHRNYLKLVSLPLDLWVKRLLPVIIVSDQCEPMCGNRRKCYKNE